MQNIYRCTIISCPPHLQKEAVHFLEKFKTDKRDLVDWLYKIYCGEIQREDPRITERGWARKRMDAIIGAASKGAKEDVKKNIINLVHKEGFRIKYEGSMEIKIKQENSLYQLISAMKRYYRLCENSQ